MFPTNIMIFFSLLGAIVVNGSDQKKVRYTAGSPYAFNSRLTKNDNTFELLPAHKNAHETKGSKFYLNTSSYFNFADSNVESSKKCLILKKVFTYLLTIGNYIIPVFLLPTNWFTMTSLNCLLQGSEFPIISGTLMIANIVQLTQGYQAGEGELALAAILKTDDLVRYPLMIVGMSMWDLGRNLALTSNPERKWPIKVPESMTLCIGIANCVMSTLQTPELFWPAWTISLLQNLSFDWLREYESETFRLQDHVHVFNAITVFMINLWAIFLNFSSSGQGTLLGVMFVGLAIRLSSLTFKKIKIS